TNFMISSSSMADVFHAVEENQNLSSKQRCDQCSAIRRICTLLNTKPEHLPAQGKALSKILGAIHPTQHNIKLKTWRNIKSNILAAIRSLPKQKRFTNNDRLNSNWSVLYNILPTERYKYGLSRFMRYCSYMGVMPLAVDDTTIDDFLVALETNTLLTDKHRHDAHRRTTLLWNEVSVVITIWPNNKLTIPNYKKPRTTRPFCDFPKSFQEDVDNYLNWLADPDPFAEHHPPKRCRPRTIELRQKQIQLMASATVAEGIAITDIKTLSDLLDPDNIKHALSYYLNKKGKDNAFIIGLGATFMHIARHWLKLDNEKLKTLKEIRRRLGQRPRGMTEKNRDTLRQFESDMSRRLLLNLPEQLKINATQQRGIKRAITLQLAITVELLLTAPIRISNLASLQFEQHLVKPGGNKDRYHLVLSKQETKNRVPLEFLLSDKLTTMLDEYRKTVLPELASKQCRYLYPGKNGVQKRTTTLAQQIKGTIFKETGLSLTPHQFRHLCAMFYLEANPGQYETVRQLLGHTHLKTTTDFYASMSTREAQRLFDNTIQEERARLSDLRER
ncbi:MAG TPA: site-specific integrase, partial [Candidatus Thioglobus sp.]|nr:site-specific integrase [Candidatus Thioglobus sp.]